MQTGLLSVRPVGADRAQISAFSAEVPAVQRGHSGRGAEKSHVLLASAPGTPSD